VRVLPLTTLALALTSAVNLFVANATQPLISKPYSTHDWWHWTATRSFTETILAPGRHTWWPLAVAGAASLAALAAAAVSIGRPPRLDLEIVPVALLAWAIAHETFPRLDHTHRGAAEIAAVLATATFVARCAAVIRSRARRRSAGRALRATS